MYVWLYVLVVVYCLATALNSSSSCRSPGLEPCGVFKCSLCVESCRKESRNVHIDSRLKCEWVLWGSERSESRLGWILTYGWNNKDLAGEGTLLEALGVDQMPSKTSFIVKSWPEPVRSFLSHLHPHWWCWRCESLRLGWKLGELAPSHQLNW